VGRKRVIVVAMIGLAIPATLVATAANLSQLVLWRFAQGLFTPGIIAVAMAYISEETASELVGSTMATYVTGTVVGGFAGRFAAGFLGAHFGWRAALASLGLATFGGALVTWRVLPPSTRFVRHASPAASIRALIAHLRNRQLLATYAVGFNVLFCLVGAFTYVNFYLADQPFHLGPAGLASIFGVYLIGAAVTPLAGRILDRIGYRSTLVAAAALSATGMALTLVQRLPFVVAGLALAASGAFASQSAASSHVGAAAGKARSSAAGLYVGFYYLGGCVGSIVPGLLWKRAGWLGCVALMIAMQAAMAWIAYALWEPKRAE
jgi:predicted MFS family arabinose efflux permease